MVGRVEGTSISMRRGTKPTSKRSTDSRATGAAEEACVLPLSVADVVGTHCVTRSFAAAHVTEGGMACDSARFVSATGALS